MDRENGVEVVKTLNVSDDLRHHSSTLTFLTLTALIICGASLEIIQRNRIM